MQNNKPNKRLTAVDKNYKRPDKTYQDTLTNKEIKDKLKDYKKIQYNHRRIHNQANIQ
jgi:hypothetical protein